MTELLVRVMQDADVPAAAGALTEVHRSDGYPVEGVRQPEAWLTPPEVMRSWVAEVGGRIVGHVALMHPHGEDAVRLWQQKSGEEESQLAVLARLFVVREARKLAAGTALMQAAMNFAREASVRLVLDVMIKDEAAIRLYERLGWRQIGEASHQFGEGQEIPALCYVWPGS